jgi:hypothetical protein
MRKETVMKDTQLTWDDLAKLYNSATGMSARTKPMREVFRWAEAQPNKFKVDKHGYLWLKNHTEPNQKRKEQS